MEKKRPEIIVALDLDDPKELRNLLVVLGDEVMCYKVGGQLFTRLGPEIVHDLKRQGKKVFLDLKFHDIPTTVSKAVTAAAALGVDMLTLHASGGFAMMTSAAAAVRNHPSLRLIAVTVLTSMDEAMSGDIGISVPIAEQVHRLAQLAHRSGMHGMVSSAGEGGALSLRRMFGNDFILVVPGIRCPGEALQDQRRTVTPSQASEQGIDYIVLGRSITEAADPNLAVRDILQQL